MPSLAVWLVYVSARTSAAHRTAKWVVAHPRTQIWRGPLVLPSRTVLLGKYALSRALGNTHAPCLMASKTRLFKELKEVSRAPGLPAVCNLPSFV